MLVYLNEYRHDEAGETVQEGEAVADTDAEEYFGKDELGPEDDWERVEHDGETILRKSSTHDVTAVSVPEEGTEADDPELPGQTIQLREPGEDTYYVEQAEIVEAVDDDP